MILDICIEGLRCDLLSNLRQEICQATQVTHEKCIGYYLYDTTQLHHTVIFVWPYLDYKCHPLNQTATHTSILLLNYWYSSQRRTGTPLILWFPENFISHDTTKKPLNINVHDTTSKLVIIFIKMAKILFASSRQQTFATSQMS